MKYTHYLKIFGFAYRLLLIMNIIEPTILSKKNSLNIYNSQ